MFIYRYILTLLNFSFSTFLILTLYYAIYNISLIPKSTKNIFFGKTIDETIISLNNKRDANIIDKILDKFFNVIDKYFIDLDKYEIDINNANIKEIKNVYDIVKLGFIYSIIFFIAFFAFNEIGGYFLPEIKKLGVLKIINIIVVPLGFLIPILQIKSKNDRRNKIIRIEIPDVLDIIRQGVATGYMFTDSLREARPRDGGVVDKLLVEVISEIETSGDYIVAINNMGNKINDYKIKEFLQQLVIAADSESKRQVEICTSLAENVRELDDISKDLQIDKVEGSLELNQYVDTGFFAIVFLSFIIYDTYLKFK